jgi:hypothetical protein
MVVQLVMDKFKHQPLRPFIREGAASRTYRVIQRCLETMGVIDDALTDFRRTGARYDQCRGQISRGADKCLAIPSAAWLRNRCCAR